MLLHERLAEAQFPVPSSSLTPRISIAACVIEALHGAGRRGVQRSRTRLCARVVCGAVHRATLYYRALRSEFSADTKSVWTLSRPVSCPTLRSESAPASDQLFHIFGRSFRPGVTLGSATRCYMQIHNKRCVRDASLVVYLHVTSRCAS